MRSREVVIVIEVEVEAVVDQLTIGWGLETGLGTKGNTSQNSSASGLRNQTRARWAPRAGWPSIEKGSTQLWRYYSYTANCKITMSKNNNESMLSMSIVKNKILQITKDLILFKVNQKAAQRKSCGGGNATKNAMSELGNTI